MIDLLFTKDEIPSMANFNKRFEKLNDLSNFLGNEYMWARGVFEEQLVEQTGSLLEGYETYTVLWSTEIEFSETGVPSLKNPTTTSFTVQTGDATFFRGKYFRQTTSRFHTGIYKVTESATFSKSGKTHLLFNSGTYEVTTATLGIVDYVNSPDPNAYPIDDGYIYKAFGQLGEKVQIATGSYIGTGAYGSGNPNSLTFSFEPKMVLITCSTYATYRSLWSHFSAPLPRGYVVRTDNNGNPVVSGNAISYCTWGANFTFYHTANAEQQMNENGVKYQYVALG